MKKLSHKVYCCAIFHSPRFFGGFAVMAHHQAARVGPGGELVVPAAVDLHLVLVEHVAEVARDHALGQRLALGVLQGIRCVGQALDLVFLDQPVGAAEKLALRHHAAPDLGQLRQHLTVAVALNAWGVRHGLAHAGEVGEQVVEAAVFQVDHDHMLDVGLELGIQGVAGWRMLLRCGLGRWRQAADCHCRCTGLQQASPGRVDGR